MKKIILLSIVLLLTACQSTMFKKEGRYIEAKAKPFIEITQSLRVAPNSARAYLQQGEVISAGQLNLYDINCEIEINTVSEQAQVIEPGLFNILSIGSEESPIVMFKPVMVASLTLARGGGSGGSPVDIKRFYRFKLLARNPNSKTQVRSMQCRGAQDQPYLAKLPTFEEMQQATGEYIKLNF